MDQSRSGDTEIVHRRKGEHAQPELPPTPESTGVPTFVFHNTLSEADRPSAERRTLEVVLLWHEQVMKVAHFGQPAPVLVGDHLKNDFRVAADAVPTERFPLVEPDGNDFVVNWSPNMTLEVRGDNGEIRDESTLTRAGLVRTYPSRDFEKRQYKIGLHDKIAIQAGDVTFVIQYVSPARLVEASLLRTIDFYFTKILSLSFLVHLFLILAVLLTPFDPDGLTDDLFKNPNRFAQLLLKEQEKKKTKFDLEGAKGARHKDKEGQFGKKDKPKKDALASTKGAPKVDPNKREKDRKIALDSGIFAALKGNQSAVSNVFGPGGLGSGINQAMGGLRGTAMGDAGGAGGLGTRGSGPGGGGNSLGIGGLGDGTGRGSGGLGNVDLGGRGKGKYQVIPGRTITKGCLSQEVVGRVLSRVQNQAKYCYEKELSRNPNLAGKVTTFFMIGPTGAVVKSQIQQSTMGDPAVEDCLLKVIERLRFPPCAGGGTADVTYPWVFKTGGD